MYLIGSIGYCFIFADGPVFGCNFAKLCEHEKNDVPAIVRRCIAAIEKKGMHQPTN